MTFAHWHTPCCTVLTDTKKTDAAPPVRARSERMRHTSKLNVRLRAYLCRAERPYHLRALCGELRPGATVKIGKECSGTAARLPTDYLVVDRAQDIQNERRERSKEKRTRGRSDSVLRLGISDVACCWLPHV